MKRNGSLISDVRVLGICREDTYKDVLGDPLPRAVRWANRSDRFGNVQWSKWHFTEGNGSFTACGRPVVLFQQDGSPQEHDLDRIECHVCKLRVAQACAGNGKQANDDLSKDDA